MYKVAVLVLLVLVAAQSTHALGYGMPFLGGYGGYGMGLGYGVGLGYGMGVGYGMPFYGGYGGGLGLMGGKYGMGYGMMGKFYG